MDRFHERNQGTTHKGRYLAVVKVRVDRSLVVHLFYRVYTDIKVQIEEGLWWTLRKVTTVQVMHKISKVVIETLIRRCVSYFPLILRDVEVKGLSIR